MKLFFLYFNTIRKLKIIQILYRIKYLFYIPRFKKYNNDLLLNNIKTWHLSIRKKDSNPKSLFTSPRTSNLFFLVHHHSPPFTISTLALPRQHIMA